MSLFFFILILVALIVVHEFGHFSVAKLFGIRVDEFGIGFPPRLLSVKWGETVYSVNLLFFGGFVRIFGEHEEEKNNPRSFAHKPRTVQSAVVAAGIICNILFAWLILSVGYMVGLPTPLEHRGVGEVYLAHPTVLGVLPGSPAEKAGLLSGDVIEKLQTESALLDVETLSTNRQATVVRQFINDHQDESLVLVVSRDGIQKNFLAKATSGFVPERKAIGIQLDDVGILKLPVHLAMIEGAIATYDMTVSTAKGLATFFAQIVRGVADFGSVAGPIGIATIGAQAVHDGFAAAITITALISINLAIINILPIPGLDGGRLFLILIEGVRGKPVSSRFTLALTVSGFALLIGLMLLVSYHDVVRLIG